MQERRVEARMMCADMVKVSWKDADGRGRSAMALLEDISASGACLQLETPLPPGVTIQWSSTHRQFRAVVRYCVYKEIGYFAGVEFNPSSKWSRETYEPQHLFDPRQLLR